MDQWLVIVGAVLSVFSVIGVGAGLRRLNWLTAEADQSLIKLIIRVLLPCLILHVIVGNSSLRDWHNIAMPPVLALMSLLAGFGTAFLAARHLGAKMGLDTPVRRRTFIFNVGIFNYGYIPVPLVMVLYPDDPGTLGVLLVFGTGVELACWTLGVTVLAGSMGGRWWTRLLNPPSFAIVAAIALNFVGADRHVPAAVMYAVKMLGDCSVPMGLILVGATITDELGATGDGRGAGWPLITGSCLLRLAIVPAVMLLVAVLLPESWVELRRVIVIESAMPAAVFPIIIARHYGGDASVAVRVALGTNLVSLVTIPLWIKMGMNVTGLG